MPQVPALSNPTQDIQLFTPGGDLVGTVTVDVLDGRMPDSVRFADRIYALKNGRYVEIQTVPGTRVA